MQWVERVQVAAPPGRVWQVAAALRWVGFPAAGRPRPEIRWVSREPVDGTETADDVEVEWRLRVVPGWNGSEVELGATVAGRKAERDRAAARVRVALTARQVVMLGELKRRSESM